MFPLWQSRAPAPRGDLPWILFAGALLASFGHAALGRRGALLAAALTVVVSLLRLWHQRRPVRTGELVLASGTLRRRADRGTPGELLVSRGELLGISLLADRAPGTALLVLTTPSRVRVLAVAVRTREELAELAALLPPVRSEAVGAPVATLRLKDAVRLLSAVMAEFPHAAERMFMRGARGESISLDRSELRIGQSRVLLDAPFDFRTFAFFESTGRVVSAYQGAWIKQVHDASMPWEDDVVPESHECVFVAAMPGAGDRPWPILDPAETALLLRAPRHAVDSLLFPSLQRRLAGKSHVARHTLDVVVPPSFQPPIAAGKRA